MEINSGLKMFEVEKEPKEEYPSLSGTTINHDSVFDFENMPVKARKIIKEEFDKIIGVLSKD